MAWHDGLTTSSPQYLIAALDVPQMRVLAGPGTGKSFSLKRRVARLLESNSSPERILVVTFTRVAAEDLYREMQSLQVAGCENVQACTLHSLCFQLICKQEILASTNRYPRVLNEYELDALLADLEEEAKAQQLDFGNKKNRRRRVIAYMAAWARLQHEDPEHQPGPLDGEFQASFDSWNRFHRCMHIGEVVPILLKYLVPNPHCLERRLFDHVLADEFQDLNKAEQRVLSYLAEAAKNSIIGDDDQSIYGFKHAHPEGIQHYEKTYQNTHDLSLDECYRCPTTVVEMANALISVNKLRMAPPRQLAPKASNGPGDVKITQFSSLQSEVRYVSDEILQLVQSGALVAGQVLVLTPRKKIGLMIKERLSKAGVPVQSCFQEEELESEDAQEKLALLKLIVYKYDRASLRWLLGSKSASFLNAQYRILRAHCEETGQEPWDVLCSQLAGSGPLKKISNLEKRFSQIHQQVSAFNEGQDFLLDVWLPDGNETTKDLRSLALTIQGENQLSADELLKQLIQSITQPEIPEVVEEVRIMSLHKSKGLSAHGVFIVGCVDGLLPRKEDDDVVPLAEAQRRIEEQRRLFYVAITRVKADPNAGKPGILRISSCAQMLFGDAQQLGAESLKQSYGQMLIVRSCPFLNELGSSRPPIVKGP